MRRWLIGLASMLAVWPGGVAWGLGAERAGDVGALALPAAALAATYAADDASGRWQWLRATAATGAVTAVLKLGVDSTRPNGEPHAFPSMHTALAFSGAAFLQRRYGWRWGAPAYAGASLVGWSRVVSNQHWWRDVIAGGAIAVLANAYFTTPRPLAVTPLLSEDGVGLYARLRW